MNCADRGRCNVTFSLATRPPAAVSNTAHDLRKNEASICMSHSCCSPSSTCRKCLHKGRKKLSATCEKPHRSLLCFFFFSSFFSSTRERNAFFAGATIPFNLRHRGDAEISLFLTTESLAVPVVANRKSFGSSNGLAEFTDTLLANAPDSESVFRFQQGQKNKFQSC